MPAKVKKTETKEKKTETKGSVTFAKPKSAWMIHLADYYKKMKAKDPCFTYKQAMQGAKLSYKKDCKK
jgi:hypothetical protein